MKIQTRLTKLLPALALAAIMSIFAASSAQADTVRTGMFGIARGQVARINAVNFSDHSIQVAMVFMDATGRPVGRDAKTIAPGQAVFFDVVFDPAAGELNRTELRALVMHPPDPCRITVEVFDGDTGKTAIILPAVQ
jgi:hypothetical protein